MDDAKQRNAKALMIAYEDAGHDGAHHKDWVIDQMVRALTGDDYEAWIEEYEQGGEYRWDEGCPP